MDGVAMRPSNNLECTIKLGYQLLARIESFAVINLLIVWLFAMGYKVIDGEGA